MNSQEKNLTRLLRQIEIKVGREMKTPKDFNFLAGQIYEQTHEKISVSTLKRLWGYVPSYKSLRSSTLDLLARFVGFDSFDHFCQQATESPESTAAESLHSGKKIRRGSSLWLGVGLFAALLLSFVLWKWGVADKFTDRQVLKCGQTFASYEEFLSLFNIKATDCQYYQPIPACSVAYVWAPQYNHPTYHNQGNPDSLMPTITEYLSLHSLHDSLESRKLQMEKQKNFYATAIRNNHVRVVFMKNLPGDTCFTFTGIYHVSFVLSDTTKVVWIRVRSECNLNDLENLAKLRN